MAVLCIAFVAPPSCHGLVLTAMHDRSVAVPFVVSDAESKLYAFSTECVFDGFDE